MQPQPDWLAWHADQRFAAFSDADINKHWQGHRIESQQASIPALLDLALYFCLWTEAANIKHMPETLWFLFWAMRHSPQFQQILEATHGKSDDSNALFPDLLARDHNNQVVPSAWQTQLLSLRERRIVVRNSVLKPDKLDEVDRIMARLVPVRLRCSWHRSSHSQSSLQALLADPYLLHHAFDVRHTLTDAIKLELFLSKNS
jgi:1,3-beta-glucan synthase subunit FKS1, domain-1